MQKVTLRQNFWGFAAKLLGFAAELLGFAAELFLAVFLPRFGVLFGVVFAA